MTAPTMDAIPRFRSELAGYIGDDDLEIERINMSPEALTTLPEEVSRVIGGTGSVALLVDATPMSRRGEDLKKTAARLIEAVAPLTTTVLGPDDGRLNADEATLDTASDAVTGYDCVVTVGSGTISDIGKVAAHRNGGLPLVMVQTAASVNGYADDRAVILKDGVKRTIGAQWPTSLIIDTPILEASPKVLSQSGLGEMLSMFTAPLDWELAHQMGYANGFVPIAEVYHDRGQRLLNEAATLADSNPTALDNLADLLTVSGLVMGVTGQTAPSSGAEHLVSHMLDMSAAAVGLPSGLHGAQVGVASVVVACIWEDLVDRLDPSRLRCPSSSPTHEEMEPRVRAAFSHLDGGSAMASECWSDYSEKLTTWSKSWEEAADGRVAAWDEFRQSGKVPSAATLAEALHAAGAPARFSDLNVQPDRAIWALQNAPLMRERFTIIDLALLTGNWKPDDVKRVLERASAVGGGL